MLLRPAAQLELLDEHGALRELRRNVFGAHASWKRAERAREDAEGMAASAIAEQDRLRWMVDELAALAPEPGEWEGVEAEQKRLSHAVGLLEGAQSAIETLREAEDAALARIATSASRLGQLAAYDERLKKIVELIDSAQVQLDEAVGELQRYVDRSDLDASRLSEVDARLSALHGAARRFRSDPRELAALLAESREKLAALAAAADLDALRAAEQSAQQAYDKAAAALTAARRKAARRMSIDVTRAMQDLAMAGGRFDVELADAAPTSHGHERVEFMVSAHAATALRPLVRVASGGELARISLAIAVIAAAATPVPTLIFDEVDAGIGGAVAETVGRLLKQLGQTRQVLCVTHLPQVAARADQHYAVSKTTAGDGRPLSRLGLLERRSRVDELARMLGGQEITETTRKHAREMLAG
jgi:DNA repair protein RecN (Recombination protein N)